MSLFALLLNVGALLCLYAAWRTHSAWQGAAHFAGWSLVLLSGWAWVLAIGVEFGISLLFLVSGVCAWLLVMWHYRQVEQTQTRHRGSSVRRLDTVVTTTAPAGLSLPGLPAIAQQLRVFLIAVPLAGAASALLVTAVVQLLPWQQGDKLVFTLYSLPLVWGAACWWACAMPRSWLPAGVFVVAAFPSLMFLYG
ncbi:hypothetical protein [Pseudohongiella sp.]|uniref:Uncharacterized protein n=1 Tax=marine sediment metagenome TaxID=412755 RepID=A0A0F9VVF5_9ZZZZ|nr:hypothetical protein [Pseudohongiella sp.]HDZ07950.1 hypothetical protein [Pseudohongiella sp.]HEA64443.1 hypothetical protein [Pseudohongiella sp.]